MKKMSRKAFAAALERADKGIGKYPIEGKSLVGAFREMITPLDKEVAELRTVKAELDKVASLLDAQIEQNSHLYDRLELALSGGRPPPGILSIMAALEPLAKAAKALDGAFQDGVLSNNNEVGISVYVRGTLCAVDSSLTVHHFRDAARTLAWWREGNDLKFHKGKKR